MLFSKSCFTCANTTASLRRVLLFPLLTVALLGTTLSSGLAVVPTPPPPPSVVVTPGGSPTPIDPVTGLSGPLDLGDSSSVTGTSTCSAVVNDAPATNEEVSVDGPHWHWDMSGSFLDDGLSATDPYHDPLATGGVSLQPEPHSPDTDSTCDYLATFTAPGDYVLTLTASATYYETVLQGPDTGKVTTVTYSGSDSPGIPDPDAASSSTTPASALLSSASLSAPADVGNGAPAPAKPAPKIVSVAGNSKSVYITSDLGTTSHKGGPDPKGGDPKPQPNPVGIVDTTNDLFGTTIGYQAHITGAWPKGSNYLWHDNWGDTASNPNGGKTDSGDFSGSSIPGFSVYYAATATTAHVFLHLKTTPDKTSNLNVRFHDTIENFQSPSNLDEDHPLPTLPTKDNYGPEWKKLGPTQDKSIEFESTITGSVKSTVTTETTVGVEGEVDGITLKLEEQYGVENEKEYGVDNSTKQVLEFRDGYLYYVFWGLGWTRHFGTYDVYDTHGYEGRDHWHADIPQLVPGGGVLVIFRPVIDVKAD